MATKILGLGSKVKFTLTGMTGEVIGLTVKGLEVKNKKGEIVTPSLSEVQGMLDSGALEVLEL